MAIMSPAKNGEMQLAKYWIIKVNAENIFENPYTENTEVHPIESFICGEAWWKNAPQLMKMLKPHHPADRWIGRRIDDEVELFDQDDEEEFNDIKEVLKKQGFTVRSYIPSGEVSKFKGHTHKEIMGGGKNTLMKKILEFTTDWIACEERSRGHTAKYGFIADFPGKSKTLVFARVDEDIFATIDPQDKQSIMVKNQVTGQDQECTVIGYVLNSKPNFNCEEEITKSYFSSLGKFQTASWADLAGEKEQAERDAQRLQKKQAKKHRRQMTQSTVTSPSEKSFASLSTQESNEDIKARQRERQNAKRKAQRERKRAKVDEIAEDTIFITAATDEVKTTGKETLEQYDLVEWMENDLVELKDKRGNEFIRHASTIRQVNTTKSPSGDDSSGSDSGEEIQVIHPSNMAAIRQAFQRQGTIMMISPRADNNGLGLTHLGRGL